MTSSVVDDNRTSSSCPCTNDEEPCGALAHLNQHFTSSYTPHMPARMIRASAMPSASEISLPSANPASMCGSRIASFMKVILFCPDHGAIHSRLIGRAVEDLSRSSQSFKKRPSFTSTMSSSQNPFQSLISQQISSILIYLSEERLPEREPSATSFMFSGAHRWRI